MAKALALLVLVPAVFILFLLGCSNGDRGAQEREEFRREVEVAIDRLEEGIRGLRQQAAKATAEARPEIEERIRGLEDEKAEVQRRLEDLRSATDEEWEQAKPEIRKNVEDLRRSLDEAIAKIREKVG